eukprot:tig00000821_g4469.t1
MAAVATASLPSVSLAESVQSALGHAMAPAPPPPPPKPGATMHGTQTGSPGQSQSFKGVDFAKILDIFTNKHSAELHDRQVAALEKIWRRCQSGIISLSLATKPLCRLAPPLLALTRAHVVKDLPQLQEVMRLSAARISAGHAQFVEPFCRILLLCAVPFVKEFAHEELTGVEDVCSTIATVGRMLSCPEPQVQMQAANTLIAVASLMRRKPTVETDGELVRQALLVTPRMVLESGVVEAVVAALRAEQHAGVQLAIVRCLREFSYADDLCPQITQAGALELVVNFLQLDFEHEGIPVVVELLWNVLESDPESRAVLGSWHAVNTLKELAARVFCDGYRTKHKELRNELLIIATLLAYHGENRKYFLETGFLELLLVFSTAAELELRHEAVRPHFLATGAAELETRKWMWGLLSMLSTHGASLEGIVRGELLRVLLLYLEGPEAQAASALPKWTPAQLRDLQATALSVLFALVPLCGEEFQRLGGPRLLLAFLAAQARPDGDARLRQRALALLVNVAPLPGFGLELGRLGALPLMLGLAGDPSQAYVARQDAVSVVALLCDGCDENKYALGKEGGVPLLSSHLRWGPGEGGQREQLVTAVVDCVWRAVVGHPRNEARFLNANGLAALLDLLDDCPELMRFQVMGCLADLLENPEARDLFFHWRSRRSARTAVRLLLAFWEEEEAKFGIADDRGLLANSEAPLEGTRVPLEVPGGTGAALPSATLRSLARAPSGASLRSSAPAPAPAPALGAAAAAGPSGYAGGDAGAAAGGGSGSASARSGAGSDSVERLYSQDIKTKIYCIFRRVGFERTEGLEARQRMTLALVERYLEFREGEVWREIRAELDAEGTRPVSPDAARLEAAIARDLEAAGRVQAAQGSHLEAVTATRLAEERDFYRGIVERAREGASGGPADSKVASRLIPALTFAARQEAKAKKAEMLARSRKAYVGPQEEADEGHAAHGSGAHSARSHSSQRATQRASGAGQGPRGDLGSARSQRSNATATRSSRAPAGAGTGRTGRRDSHASSRSPNPRNDSSSSLLPRNHA